MCVCVSACDGMLVTALVSSLQSLQKVERKLKECDGAAVQRPAMEGREGEEDG